MVLGVGVDMLRVSRMERLLAHPRFMSRVFTDEERAYIALSGHKAAAAAGLFCAREAYVKAMGLGLFDLPFHDYFVAHHAAGRPYLCFRQPNPGLNVQLSITHEDGLAMAMVVVERREAPPC